MNTIAELVREIERGEPALAEAVLELYRAARKPMSTAFSTRAVRRVARVAQSLTEPELGAAVGKPSDASALLAALQFPEAAATEDADQLRPALLRGLEAKVQLLTAEGGTWGVGEVAEVLHISRQAVEKRRQRRQLLAVTLGSKGYRYPRWQFSEDGVLPGLPDALRSLAANDVGEWMALDFMLTPDEFLDGRSPIRALNAGDVDAVRRVAAAFGAHGGR